MIKFLKFLKRKQSGRKEYILDFGKFETGAFQEELNGEEHMKAMQLFFENSTAEKILTLKEYVSKAVGNEEMTNKFYRIILKPVDVKAWTDDFDFMKLKKSQMRRVEDDFFYLNPGFNKELGNILSKAISSYQKIMTLHDIKQNAKN